MTVRNITIPLKTEPWQRDLLGRRMELCRSLYNAELNEVAHRYHAMQHDPAYQAVRHVIDETYALPAAERQHTKESPAYRQAMQQQSILFRTYGLTPYTIHDRAIEMAKPYAAILPSRVAHFTIGIPLWQATHGVLLGTQPGFCYKRVGDIRVLMSDGRSGIRLLGPNGRGCRDGIVLNLPSSGEEEDTENNAQWKHSSAGPATPVVVYGKGKGRRAIRLPLILDPADTYMSEALARPFRIIRLLRRPHHGRDRYYLQLTCETDPPQVAE